MRKTGLFLATVLAITAWPVSPAAAVPTGTYEPGGLLQITAQPGDEDVSIEVTSDKAPLAAPAGSYTTVRGEVDLTNDDCVHAPDGTADDPRPMYVCENEPFRVVLDGGYAHADLVVDMWQDNITTVRLTAGGRGGLLKAAARHTWFVGKGGPDRIVYRVEDFSMFSTDKVHYLEVHTRAGDDVALLRGVGGPIAAPNGARAILRLGPGDDEFRADTDRATPVVVLGGRDEDRLHGGPGDVLKGGDGADLLVGGRVLVGGGGFDRIRARRAAETVQARDGLRDVISCSDRRTVVYADPVDEVFGVCRVVR